MHMSIHMAKRMSIHMSKHMSMHKPWSSFVVAMSAVAPPLPSAKLTFERSALFSTCRHILVFDVAAF